MKIGIQKNITNLGKGWVKYCEDNEVQYKLIDSYKNDVIQQLEDCDAFMWNYNLLQSKDVLNAKPLLLALEHSGKVCFPSINELWHYDDKLAQKYLLEATDVPMVPSFVFYDEEIALDWAGNTNYPKVFKLRGGAGSSNVRLVKNEKEAKQIIKRAFSKGYPAYSKWRPVREAFEEMKKGKRSFTSFAKRLYRYFIPVYKGFIEYKEKDYVYFQEFIANNDSDIRLVVVNQDKIFGLKRFNRKDDFRASGSGNMKYLTPELIDEKALKVALDTAIRLNMDSIAYDIVYDSNRNPLIIEISFAYTRAAYEKCPGYWDEKLEWHEGIIGNYSGWMVEKIIERIKSINA